MVQANLKAENDYALVVYLCYNVFNERNGFLTNKIIILDNKEGFAKNHIRVMIFLKGVYNADEPPILIKGGYISYIQINKNANETLFVINSLPGFYTISISSDKQLYYRHLKVYTCWSRYETTSIKKENDKFKITINSYPTFCSSENNMEGFCYIYMYFGEELTI